MDSGNSTHPGRRDLMLYADGELPHQEAARVKAHLEACWSCRLQAEQLEAAILSFTDFSNSVLKPAAGPPPREWRTFDAKLRGLVADSGRPSLLSRLHIASFSWRFAPSLATIAVFFFFMFLWLQQPPLVSASQLLEGATESRASDLRDITKPVIYQKFRVRTDGASVTREIWNDTVNGRVKDAWSSSGTRPSEALNFPRVFAANRLNWEDPLSAASFAQWRSGLKEKTDRVVRENNYLTLQTTSIASNQEQNSEGRIVEASLTVRATDYHSVATRFRIVVSSEEGISEHRVELAEEDYAVVTLAAVTPTLFSPAPAEISLSSTRAAKTLTEPVPPGPSLDELVDSEVAARYTLHLAGADLGEPIDIQIEDQQEPAAVTIRGLVKSDERKQELVAALEKIAHVTPKLQTEEEAALQAPPTAPAAPEADVVSAQSPIQEELQEYFGDPAEVEKFSRRAFAVTEALMARAWALHHLSGRYPPAVESQLSPSLQQLIGTMRRDHRRTMRERTAELVVLLQPVLLSFTEAPAEVPPAAALFATAQQVERLTLGLLSGSDLVAPSDPDQVVSIQPAQAASDLLAALRALEIQLKENQ